MKARSLTAIVALALAGSVYAADAPKVDVPQSPEAWATHVGLHP